MLFVILSVAKYLDFYAVIRFFTAFRMTSPRQKNAGQYLYHCHK